MNTIRIITTSHVAISLAACLPQSDSTAPSARAHPLLIGQVKCPYITSFFDGMVRYLGAIHKRLPRWRQMPPYFLPGCKMASGQSGIIRSNQSINAEDGSMKSKAGFLVTTHPLHTKINLKIA